MSNFEKVLRTALNLMLSVTLASIPLYITALLSIGGGEEIMDLIIRLGSISVVSAACLSIINSVYRYFSRREKNPAQGGHNVYKVFLPNSLAVSMLPTLGWLMVYEHFVSMGLWNSNALLGYVEVPIIFYLSSAFAELAPDIMGIFIPIKGQE